MNGPPNVTELPVPQDERPSITRYVVLTVIGLGIVHAAVGVFTQNTSSAIFDSVVLSVAVVLDVAIGFLMIQSLIEEWFQAVTIVEE